MWLRRIFWMICGIPLAIAGPGQGPPDAQPSAVASPPSAPAQPLSPEQKARFDTGKELYAVLCGACHQPHGNGQDGLAPPLANSEWAIGSEARVVRVALQGLRGPIKVKGKVYQLEMPPMSILEDAQIAALLTYIRREWGNTGDPVDPKTVAKIRADTEKREEPWTEAELLKIP